MMHQDDEITPKTLALRLRLPNKREQVGPLMSTAADVGGVEPSIQKPKKRLFHREIRQMMYGFGDVSNPLPETVEVLEDAVLDYIHGMTTKAMRLSARRGRLLTEDFIFLVRKDRKKHARVRELLRMYDELREARKAFEEPGADDE